MDITNIKSISRRKFVTNGLNSMALIPLIGSSLSSYFSFENNLQLYTKPASPLNILILGGTSFLGPHQIAYALQRGHTITTFTRGKTIPSVHREIFNDVEQLIGDRENNLEALKGRKWDAVIDNSGRRVHWTKATAELLEEHVKIYAYTSSVSVFYPYYSTNLKESDPIVLQIPEKLEEGEQGLYDYGVMKANSELAAKKVFGDKRTIVIRPTFMVGPADRTNRFMYWPTQLALGGEIIIPGKADDPVQFIDVRDIAEWMIRLIENETTGTFNGVGPVSDMGIMAFAHGAHASFSSKVKFHTISDYAFLREHGLGFQAPWVIPEGKFEGMLRANNDLAEQNGIQFRTLSQTMTDLYEWWYSESVSGERRHKFNTDPNELHNRKAELIKLWQNKS